VDRGGADLDHEATGNDHGRDLDQAVRKHTAESHAPRGERRRIAEQEARQERERETAQAGGDYCQQRREHEGQKVVAEDAHHLLHGRRSG